MGPAGGGARDLPLLALLQIPFLGLAALCAKVIAVRFAYPAAPASELAYLLLRVMPEDILGLAALWLVVLVSRKLELPGWLRFPALVALWGLFAAIAFGSFINAGVFVYFGAPLNADLLMFAPALARYSQHVITGAGIRIALAAAAAIGVALAVVPVLHRRMRPWLVRPDGGWRSLPKVSMPAAAAVGVVLLQLPAEDDRDLALRRLSTASMLLPVARRADLVARPPTRHERRILDQLAGRTETGGQAAFSAFPRKRHNIVLWVWESVGERYLRSHSPLGQAATPMLDRIAAGGSVRFSRAFAECPLSPQTDWAIMTGTSPPGSPYVLVRPEPFPVPPGLLPAVLKSAGYRTAFISSSYLKSWGEDRFLATAGFDVLEDVESLGNREKYRSARWSIDGNAVIDRALEWIDSVPGDTPLFAVLWNVETHHPYTWIGMPPELEKAGALERYLGSIEHSDGLLGSFHEALAKRGRSDTLIVVVGDHGQGLGRGGRPHNQAHGLLVYEDDLQVPLVFLHPALGPGPRVVDVRASHVDLYPTLLDLAGLPIPAGKDGVSLAGPVPPRTAVSRGMSWWPAAVRAGRYKLLQSEPRVEPALYDVEADPWESRDLSRELPDVRDALQAHLLWTTARRKREDPSFSLVNVPAALWVPWFQARGNLPQHQPGPTQSPATR